MKTTFLTLIMLLCVHWNNAQNNITFIKTETVQKHLYTLASDAMEGRKAGSPGIEKATQYIASEFEKIGLIPFENLTSFRQNFRANNTEMSNIIGVLEGRSMKDEYVVISAHYDHLGKKSEGEAIGNWTVLMQFPSKNLAYGFVTSEEYAPLMELRVNTLTDDTHAVLIPGEIAAM